MEVDSFATAFIRKRVLPQQRKQGDANLDGGGNYLSIVPQPIKPKQSKRVRKNGKSLQPQFRGQTARQLRKAMRSEMEVEKMTCTREMPDRLHALWLGYAASVINWSRFVETEYVQSTTNLSSAVNSRLENILRMDLIGSQLQVLKSITTKQAGLDGIVVMETKNIFYISDLPSVGDENVELCLHMVPKRGTIFLLHMTTPDGMDFLKAEVILNGNSLQHRPVDRATRKWRHNPKGFCQKRQPLYTDLMKDFLFDGDSPSLTTLHSNEMAKNELA